MVMAAAKKKNDIVKIGRWKKFEPIIGLRQRENFVSSARQIAGHERNDGEANDEHNHLYEVSPGDSQHATENHIRQYRKCADYHAGIHADDIIAYDIEY